MILQTFSLDEAKIKSHKMLVAEVGKENLNYIGLSPNYALINFLDLQFSNLYNVFNSEFISNEEFEYRYNDIVQKIMRFVHKGEIYHVY